MLSIVACATAESTGRDPERDVLVLLLVIHTGMLVSEIAQIEVGAPTHEVELPPIDRRRAWSVQINGEMRTFCRISCRLVCIANC
ncbi:hypothetical protein C7C56_024865 [Massilia glaciei]|uniref:Uncharacterized protein n=1 Tax=Massilia glaciei TaxID=1524097 RepID=A0A2U2HDQ3_9BURK|nr:hypothetical protein C7C56_024865 [Massilia glaciei]